MRAKYIKVLSSVDTTSRLEIYSSSQRTVCSVSTTWLQRELSMYMCGEAATNHHYSMYIATLYNYTYNAKHQVMAQSCMYVR